jgi:D-lactate dehydrogenase (cytochrome)
MQHRAVEGIPKQRVDGEQIGHFCAEIQSILAGRLVRSPAVLEAHSRDESHHCPKQPQVVIFPRSSADVAAVLRGCTRYGIPTVPFGAGTGLEGGAIPVQGGVSLDLSELNQIIEIRAEDFLAVVQPGVTHRSLNRALKSTGLFFPVDPGADATLGGMAATRASGTNAVRYGTMRENIAGLEVVLADGTVIRSGSSAKKSAAGYDLTRLFTGSEGTLGVITELTLRLQGIPEATAAAICHFETLEGAVRSVIAIIQTGIPIARIELLDTLQIEIVNRYSKLNLPVKDTLFLEFHGSTAGVQEQASLSQEIAEEHGGSAFEWQTEADARARLWKARHDVGWACKAYRPGSEFFSTDVCVPISRLAECILETKADIAKTKLVAPLVGHVGDGNFHLTILVDPQIPDEHDTAAALNCRLVERALRLGGTCTGEHGVGLGKRQFLPEEHGTALEVMREIKRCLDPASILNPGKIFLKSLPLKHFTLPRSTGHG